MNLNQTATERPTAAPGRENVTRPALGHGLAHFVWAGLFKHPQTGGIIPSQRFLIQTMLRPVPSDYSGHIIELGAGNGALTARLARRCPFARILACEINPVLARDARLRLSGMGTEGRVQVLAQPAQEVFSRLSLFLDRARPGFIISGLPLGNLGRNKVRPLLSAIKAVLAPNGWYVQFQHSLLHQKDIRTTFGVVRTSLVLLNIPPAFVYHARA